MKKLLLLIVLLIANFSNSQDSWFPLGPDDFNQPSFGKVNFSKVCRDNNNIPYVAFSDQFNNDKLSVRKFIDNKWTTVGSLGFSDGIASFISIDFDSNNTPFVAYKDTDIKIKKFDGTSWINVGTTTSNTNFQFSFKISENNTPYIAFQNSLNSDKATVKRFNGLSWELVGSDGFSVNKSNYISVDISNQNIPYVIYSDASKSNKVSVQKFENNSWGYVGSQGFSLGQSTYTYINFDNNNIPTIIYSDGSINSKFTMQKFTNNLWQTIGQSGFSSSSLSDLSFDFNANNNPYVICLNSVSKLVEVYYCNQSQWELLPIPTQNQSSFPSISLSNKDEVFISYKNITNGDFLVVNKLTNNSWSIIGDSSIVATELARCAIDNQGIIYVLYKSKVDNKAYMKKFEKGIWSDFLTTAVSEGAVNGLDIGIDNNNQICIVHDISSISGNRAVFKRFNGSSFITIATSNYHNTSILVSNFKLKFDSSNNAYLGYIASILYVVKIEGSSMKYKGTYGNFTGYDFEIDSNIIPNILYVTDYQSGKIQVKQYVDSEETFGSVVNPIAVSAGDASFVIIDNEVYLAYKNSQGAGWYKIYVKKFNGSDWVEIMNLSVSSSNYDNPLLNSQDNTLYLFYNDNQNYYANLLKQGYSSWSNIGTKNFSAAKADNPDFLFYNSKPIVLYISDTGLFGKYYGNIGALSISNFSKNSNSNAYIYPNPVVEKFKIKTEDTIINVKLYDVLGKEILNVKNLHNEIDISNLKNGIYFARIQQLNSTTTLKLIKN